MIDTEEKLRLNLKLFKKQALKAGAHEFQVYPMFCTYYNDNKDKYQLNKLQVLDVACEILIEED